jgi:hypothetical protein
MAARKPIRPASIQPHQPANQVQRDSAVGTHPTVVPNLLKPWRKNVLQESRYELVPANAPRFRLMGSRRCVAINHSLRVTVLDPLVANRHAIDVRSQVLQSCRSIAYRLDIDRWCVGGWHCLVRRIRGFRGSSGSGPVAAGHRQRMCRPIRAWNTN